jgi:hypothetical protein
MKAERVESFEYGIVREWYFQDHLAAIRTQGIMARAAIDVWAASISGVFEAWPSDRPLCLIIDLTHKNQGMSPYANLRARDLVASMRHSGRAYSVGVLLKNPFMVSVGQMMMRQLNMSEDMSIFSQNDHALAWLKKRNPHLSEVGAGGDLSVL